MEKTLSIIKPDGVERNLIGKVLTCFEGGGLQIIAATIKQLSREEAMRFYNVHRERGFFNELVDYMSRSPVFISVLAGPEAVMKHREIMGATDPSKAAPNTVRALYALSIGENTVHGSDSLEAASTEIKFFFPHL
jgi:nucleoside-diphosphate kinase